MVELDRQDHLATQANADHLDYQELRDCPGFLE